MSSIVKVIEVIAQSDKGFEDAAFEAVRKGRFKPGTKAGVPADLWQIVTVKFTP